MARHKCQHQHQSHHPPCIDAGVQIADGRVLRAVFQRQNRAYAAGGNQNRQYGQKQPPQ